MNKPASFRSVELVPVGDALGVVLPPELLERLGLGIGDRVRIAETPAGLEIGADLSDEATQMAVAREVMHRRRRALAELAK